MMGDHHVDELSVEGLRAVEVAHFHIHTGLLHRQAEGVEAFHHRHVIAGADGLHAEAPGDLLQLDDLFRLCFDDRPRGRLDLAVFVLIDRHPGHLDGHLVVHRHLAHERLVGRIGGGGGGSARGSEAGQDGQGQDGREQGPSLDLLHRWISFVLNRCRRVLPRSAVTPSIKFGEPRAVGRGVPLSREGSARAGP